jgi:eukaryotic-like serine/threonine-protein kinase
VALTPATRLGPYEILAAIGAGGMGEVYKARDTRLARTVAIKVLPAGAAADVTARARFEREAHAIAALDEVQRAGLDAPVPQRVRVATAGTSAIG